MFRDLTGVHEPSAIQQLEDGRFLVVEDENQYPFSLVTLGADGSVGSTALRLGSLVADDAFAKLDDAIPLRVPSAVCGGEHTSQIVCRSLLSYKGLSATEFLFSSIVQLEGYDEPTPDVFKFARKSLARSRHGRSQS